MNNSKGQIIGLVMLSVISFAIRLFAFNSTQYANGWDAYFYLIQIESIISEGSMHSREWSLIYPLILFIRLVVGDAVWAMKIVSSLIVASFGLSIFFTTSKFLRSQALSYTLFIFTVFSPELTYFAAQWPKNLLGMVVYIMLLNKLISKQWKWALLLLIIGIFVHRMTAFLGFITIIIWFIVSKLSFKQIAYAIAISIVLILVSHFIPGLISFYDMERLNNLFSVKAQIPPVAFVKLFGTEKISFWWYFEIGFSYLTWLICLFYTGFQLIFQKKRDAVLFVATFILTLLWFPFYYMDLTGAPYRLYHAGLLLTPLIAATLIKDINLTNKIAYRVGFILLGCSLFSYKSYQPSMHDPPYALYDRIQSKLTTSSDSMELIIAHKALAEYITYETGIDAMPWIPEYPIEEDKLYRIAYMPFPKLFEFYLNKKPQKLALSYYFVREADWQLFLKQISIFEEEVVLEEYSDWKNPSRTRPAFLLRNK